MRDVNLPWMFGFAGDPTLAGITAPIADRYIAQVNGQRVIAAAILVEKELEKIINTAVSGDPHKANVFFADQILSADWFQLSAKRKVALGVLFEGKHLDGKDKNAIEKSMSEVIALRNRFAHGHLVIRGETTCISYFRESRREDVLTDEYWTSVEQVFNSAIGLLAKGQASMGIPVAWQHAG
jgi:hypothetical protein